MESSGAVTSNNKSPTVDREVLSDSGGTRFLDLIQSLGMLLIIVLAAGIMTFASPVFLTRLNIENLLFSGTIVAVVALGQTFVILVAGIDLSVGAILALASVLCVYLVNETGLPVWLAAVAAIGAGALVGTINGVSVTVLRIPALIATLAMMSVARGIAFLITGGRNITPIPEVYVAIQGARFLGVPVVIIGTAVLAIAAHLVLTRTRFGREIYATGGNPIASRLAGIDTDRVTVMAYLISGVAAALGGLMMTARLESGAATAGAGYELVVISAVVIGGVSLFGGEGKISGVILGVMLLGLVQNAVNLLNVPPNYDYIVSGLVIAIAAALDVYRRGYVERGLRRRMANTMREKHAEPVQKFSAKVERKAIEG